MTPEEKVREAVAALQQIATEAGLSGVVVSVGGHLATNTDSINHVSVGISVGGEVFAAGAKYIRDAVALAQANARDEFARRAAAIKEQREAAERSPSTKDRLHAAAVG